MGRPQLASSTQDTCEYDFSTLHGLVNLSLFGLFLAITHFLRGDRFAKVRLMCQEFFIIVL
jgi:hypothetical protein